MQRRREIIPPTGVAYDPSAAAWFAFANITNAIEKAAENTFIIGCKSLLANGSTTVWDSFDRVYFASQKDQTTALYCAKTFTTMSTDLGIVYNSNGLLTNGTSVSLRTDLNLNLATHLTQTDSNLTILNGFNTAFAKNRTLLGVRSVATTGEAQILGTSSGMQAFSYRTGAGTQVIYTPAGGNMMGLHSLVRSSNSNLEVFINGVSQGTANTLETSSTVTHPVYFGALNDVGTASQFTSVLFQFGSIGSQIQPSSQLAFYNLVHALQTALSR